jgi:hypothetical protein
LTFSSNCEYIGSGCEENVDSVCPDENTPVLCRLDPGGETSLHATFLATTLGLRRLFSFLRKSNFCSNGYLISIDGFIAGINKKFFEFKVLDKT